MIRFNSDYTEGCHPCILAALAEHNRDQNATYGTDEHCARASALIRAARAAPDAAVQFLVGGTQTNLIVIAAALKAWQGVLCPETGHINCHETGAVEATGHKVLALPASEGKISAAQIRAAAAAHRADPAFEHIVQPGMVYISQPTELGTLYTKGELEDISAACRGCGLRLYIDGARMSCALAADGTLTLADYARLSDAFSIGGTKAGFLFGEAAVITDPALQLDFRYLVKQRGGMLAKGWLLGLQYEAMFADGAYYAVGAHAVGEARRIRTALRHARADASSEELRRSGVFSVGEITVDYNKHQVLLRGENVHLTQNEYRIVSLLAAYAGRVLTYDFILKELWGPAARGNNQVLRVHMANIRRKIEEKPAEPRYIFTEVGVGYRMAEGEVGS